MMIAFSESSLQYHANEGEQSLHIKNLHQLGNNNDNLSVVRSVLSMDPKNIMEIELERERQQNEKLKKMNQRYAVRH